MNSEYFNSLSLQKVLLQSFKVEAAKPFAYIWGVSYLQPFDLSKHIEITLAKSN